MVRKKKIKYSIHDGFETKAGARESARDLRAAGDRATVRKIPPQGGNGGRLKWGVFHGGKRKNKRRK